MWIECAEVEFSSNQEDDGANSSQSPIPSGLAFGGLEQAVNGFEEAIGHSCSCPGNDALKVVSNHPRYILHGLDL